MQQTRRPNLVEELLRGLYKLKEQPINNLKAESVLSRFLYAVTMIIDCSYCNVNRYLLQKSLYFVSASILVRAVSHIYQLLWR